MFQIFCASAAPGYLPALFALQTQIFPLGPPVLRALPGLVVSRLAVQALPLLVFDVGPLVLCCKHPLSGCCRDVLEPFLQ